MAIEPIVLEAITEKVKLAAPVVIPEKVITDLRVNFLTYTFQGLDAASGEVVRLNIVINTAELSDPAKAPLLAELEKDAKVKVLDLTG